MPRHRRVCGYGVRRGRDSLNGPPLAGARRISPRCSISILIQISMCPARTPRPGLTARTAFSLTTFRRPAFLDSWLTSRYSFCSSGSFSAGGTCTKRKASTNRAYGPARHYARAPGHVSCPGRCYIRRAPDVYQPIPLLWVRNLLFHGASSRRGSPQPITMEDRTYKQLAAIILSIVILGVAYYGSYRPMRKAQGFISTLQSLQTNPATSLADLENRVSGPLNYSSPIGQEEIVRNLANSVSGVRATG